MQSDKTPCAAACVESSITFEHGLLKVTINFFFKGYIVTLIYTEIITELSPNITVISINVNEFNSRSKDKLQKALNETKQDTL